MPVPQRYSEGVHVHIRITTRLLIEEQRRQAEERQRHQQEVIAKHRETRMRVIDEILQTERDYMHSVSLCHDVFSSSQRPRVGAARGQHQR